jgi:hypothetical protein
MPMRESVARWWSCGAGTILRSAASDGSVSTTKSVSDATADRPQPLRRIMKGIPRRH